MRRKRSRESERGIALLVAVLMLVGLSAIAMTTLTSTGIDSAAARANAGVVERASCIDEVARFAIEQIDHEQFEGTYRTVTVKNSSCRNAGLSWVNFPIPSGNDGTVCVTPEPACLGASGITSFTQPTSIDPSSGDPCEDVRAIITWAPSPYVPSRSLVGEEVGKDQGKNRINTTVRVMAAEMPTCEMRYLNTYLDVGYIADVATTKGAGTLSH